MGIVAIVAEGLGKQYRIGLARQRYYTFRDALINAAKAPWKRLAYLSVGARESHDLFWALRDVSFEVKHGEVLGIIGRNGAGKSTLLKILGRVTNPTEGWANIYGRVGSLLEVGTGFHPELTGRENIYLSGAVLGMRKGEIDKKFEEIVDFAGVEQFVETPAKRYSSGMYVRLAFAVAAHLEPEILLVDEVLAVGDAEFQKKCLGKMGEVARGGRTVLFVSHNTAAVQQLCQRGIVLDRGKISFSGDAHAAIGKYLRDLELINSCSLADRTDRRGSQWLKFTKVGFYDSEGNEQERVISGQDLFIRFYYTSKKSVNAAKILIAFNVRSSQGYLFSNLNSFDTGDDEQDIFESGYFQCYWPKFNMRSGIFDCAIFCSVNGEIVDWLQSAFSIWVEDGDFYGTGKLVSRDGGELLVDHSWSSHAF